MECHNPLDRSINRREGNGKFNRTYSTPGGASTLPEWRNQNTPESGNTWRQKEASANRLDNDFRSPSRVSERGNVSRQTPRSEFLSRQKQERSEGILARESDRKPARSSRSFSDRPSSAKADRDKEHLKETTEPLEPWEIERAKNRANRLNWSLALAAVATASPSSTSLSSSTSCSSSSFDSLSFSSSSLSSSSSSSNDKTEDGLSDSMNQMKLDNSPVVVHGRLAKLQSPPPRPSISPASGSGRRYIDPERQAEIDAQFGMSAETDTSHMLELYELDTVDPDVLVPMLGTHVEGLYQLSETQCVAIFDTKAHAQDWLRKNTFVAGKVQPLHPLRLQQYSHLLPKKFRPETTTKLARRIIFHNLAIRTERTPEEKARREKKLSQVKTDSSAWE